MTLTNTRTRFVAVCLSFLVLAMTHSPANACSAVKRVDTGSPFVVSAVLRLEGAGVVIKLVHSRVVASSAQEATALLVRSAARDYPGYSVLSTLATELDEKPAACMQRRQLDAMAAAPVRV